MINVSKEERMAHCFRRINAIIRALESGTICNLDGKTYKIRDMNPKAIQSFHDDIYFYTTAIEKICTEDE